MKCHRYYPLGAAKGDEDEMTFSDVELKVKFMKEEDRGFFVIRTYQVTDLKVGTTRRLMFR